MKTRYILFAIAVAWTIVTGTSSCSSQGKDKTIKADLATKARTEKDFAGVNFTVENGVVSLTGYCFSETSKNTVYGKVKGLYGVKDVINNIQIGPVVIGTDELLKQGVDSILKEYASVEAVTKDSIVYLNGKLQSNELQKLTKSIEMLNPRKIENQLTIK